MRNTKVTFDEFVRSKAIIPKSVYCQVYGVDNESFPEEVSTLFIYMDTFYIWINPNGTYETVAGNYSICDKMLGKVEKELWDNFAQSELNYNLIKNEGRYELDKTTYKLMNKMHEAFKEFSEYWEEYQDDEEMDKALCEFYPCNFQSFSDMSCDMTQWIEKTFQKYVITKN